MVCFLELQPVSDLKAVEEAPLLIAQWDRPDLSDDCELRYDITLQNELRLLTVSTEEKFYNFELVPCTTNDITVIPVTTTVNAVGAAAKLLHVATEGNF